MSVETGAKSAIPLRCAPNSQPFRNCSSDKSGSFAEAEAYRSFYRKLAQRHFNPRAPEGRDHNALEIGLFPVVSTHAPREGRDCQFMHNSESNCMIYAIFKLPKNPSGNHRPEMTRFMREPHV